MTDATVDPKVELAAMQAVADAIAGLDVAVAARVLRWAGEAHGITGAALRSPAAAASVASGENGGPAPTFTTFGELYSAASPESDVDRALVAGYWRQFHDGELEFGAQELNSALKDLGYGVPNITTALEALKNKKPSLLVQLRKAGTTRQARKAFKLTTAGKQFVEQMLGQQ